MEIVNRIIRIATFLVIAMSLLSLSEIQAQTNSKSGSSSRETSDQYSERELKLKQQMFKRIKDIDKLKQKGVFGENRFAYLEPTPAYAKRLQKKETTLLKEENKDRKEIYEILAKRTRTTLLQVQAVRAESIRKKSKKGMWLQDKKGMWYRKK